MKDKGTIRIKWVRSGIGFDRRQAEVIRSLGLRRLHQVVERPDVPQIRGLAAKVAHLVEILPPEAKAAGRAVEEYVVRAAPARQAVPPETTSEPIESSSSIDGGEAGEQARASSTGAGSSGDQSAGRGRTSE